MATRLQGTVKWFNDVKGFGFVVPDGQQSENGRGHFVHISAVERAGLGTLTEGQRLTYDLETDKRGLSSAVNLKVEE